LGQATYDELIELPEAYPGFISISNDIVYLMGCRSFDQFANTLRGLIDPDNHCPFCNPDRQAACLEHTTDWYAATNDFPAKGTEVMFLLLPKEHLTNTTMLRPSDWMQMGELFQRLSIRSGALVMRFGDPHFHSGSIPHLHMNVIVPTPSAEYRVPLSKPEEDRAENYARLIEYRDELQKRGRLKWLFSR